MAVHKGRPSQKRRIEERKSGKTPMMEFPRPLRRYRCGCSKDWKKVIHEEGGHNPELWMTHEHCCSIFRAKSFYTKSY
jgi:hypothetical protein